jgi:hypothetical protein
MVKKGRIFYALVSAVMLNCAWAGTVCAGFWSSDDKGKSGLDFNRGYDLNTVSTVTGRATSPPRSGEKDNLFLEIKVVNETLSVSLGPASHWEKLGIALNANDEVSVKGSRAQGLDGKSYLLAQKLVNRTAGAQVELRNEKGEPAWTARGMNGSRSGGMGGGMRNTGGATMRGGGGGGGGMMRH